MSQHVCVYTLQLAVQIVLMTKPICKKCQLSLETPYQKYAFSFFFFTDFEKFEQILALNAQEKSTCFFLRPSAQYFEAAEINNTLLHYLGIIF